MSMEIFFNESPNYISLLKQFSGSFFFLLIKMFFFKKKGLPYKACKYYNRHNSFYIITILIKLFCLCCSHEKRFMKDVKIDRKYFVK